MERENMGGTNGNSDWRVTVAVGVVLALIEIGATYLTNRWLEQYKADLSRDLETYKTEIAQKLQAYSKLGEQIGAEKAAFRKDARDRLAKIDKYFLEVCLLAPPGTADRKLDESLEQLQELLDRPAARLDLKDDANEKAIKALKDYAGYINDKLIIIRPAKNKSSTPKVSDEERRKFYEDSKPILEEARKQVDSLLEIPQK